MLLCANLVSDVLSAWSYIWFVPLPLVFCMAVPCWGWPLLGSEVLRLRARYCYRGKLAPIRWRHIFWCSPLRGGCRCFRGNGVCGYFLALGWVAPWWLWSLRRGVLRRGGGYVCRLFIVGWSVSMVVLMGIISWLEFWLDNSSCLRTSW